MIMIGAAGVECCVARRANRAACEIVIDGQLMSADAAEDRTRIKFFFSPDLGRMAFGVIVTLTAWKPTAAALKFYRDDV